MFQHPDNETGSDGIDGLFVPYGVRVAAPERKSLKRWRRAAALLSPILGLAVLGAAGWGLFHSLQRVKLANVYEALSATNMSSVFAALLLVAVPGISAQLRRMQPLPKVDLGAQIHPLTPWGFASKSV